VAVCLLDAPGKLETANASSHGLAENTHLWSGYFSILDLYFVLIFRTSFAKEKYVCSVVIHHKFPPIPYSTRIMESPASFVEQCI